MASPSIADSLGRGGQTNVSDGLLDGPVDPSDITTDGFARDILRHCKRIIDEADPAITLDDFKYSYLHWNVNTTTSPSGRHLSHLHALFQPVSLPEDTPDITRRFHDTKE